MKQFLKELEQSQKALKAKRKTGTIPDGYDWLAAMEDRRYDLIEAWDAARQVEENKLFITAALNLYHELIGSDYRHGLGGDPEDFTRKNRYRLHQAKIRKILGITDADLDG